MACGVGGDCTGEVAAEDVAVGRFSNVGSAGDVSGFDLGVRERRQIQRLLSPAGNALLGIVCWNGRRVLFGVGVFPAMSWELILERIFRRRRGQAREGGDALCF